MGHDHNARVELRIDSSRSAGHDGNVVELTQPP
jgi:hypothetical protein